MNSRKIKENIRKTRSELHLSQQETAEKLGISRTAYRNLENGSTKIFSDHISRLAELSGKTEEEIVLGYTPENDLLLRLNELNDRIRFLTLFLERHEREIQEIKSKGSNLL